MFFLSDLEKIPSSKRGKRKERKHVMKVLRENGYRSRFIKKCYAKRKLPNDRELTEKEPAPSFVLLPYVKGISERIARVLRRGNVTVGYKPINTLSHSFPKPKDRLQALQRIKTSNLQNLLLGL